MNNENEKRNFRKKRIEKQGAVSKWHFSQDANGDKTDAGHPCKPAL